MNVKRMLRAAEIVEKVDPCDFNMNDITRCILGRCARSKDPEFASLKILVRSSQLLSISWDELGAKCFGIDSSLALQLFGTQDECDAHDPLRAANSLRQAVVEYEARLERQVKARARKAAEEVAELKVRAERIMEATRIAELSPKGMVSIYEALEGLESKMMAKLTEPV